MPRLTLDRAGTLPPNMVRPGRRLLARHAPQGPRRTLHCPANGRLVGYDLAFDVPTRREKWRSRRGASALSQVNRNILCHIANRRMGGWLYRRNPGFRGWSGRRLHKELSLEVSAQLAGSRRRLCGGPLNGRVHKSGLVDTSDSRAECHSGDCRGIASRAGKR